MSITLVTGANRGIGLALAEILKERGHSVVATCRRPSRELEALGVEVVPTSTSPGPPGLEALAAAVG